MNFGELLWWYLGNARDYAAQMLPCMCAAAWRSMPWPCPPGGGDWTDWGWSVPSGGRSPCCFCMMFGAGLAALTLFPANFWRPSALAGRPAGGAHPVSPLGGHRPHLAAGAPPGDPKSGAGAVGHVFDGGQHRHLPARGRLFRPAVAQAPVVEVPGGGAGGFNGHRIHSIFHRAQRRRGRRAAEHRRGPVGLLAVLAGPGPVPPADRRVPMP